MVGGELKGLTFLDDDQVQNAEIGINDATADRLALALASPAGTVAGVALAEQQAHTAVGQNTLLHGEALLVVASADAHHITLRGKGTDKHHKIHPIYSNINIFPFVSDAIKRASLFQSDMTCLIASGEQLCSFSGNTLSPLNDYGPVGKGLLSASFSLFYPEGSINNNNNNATHLPLITQRVSSHLCGHSLLIESTQLALIINFNQLLAASSGE